MSQFKKWALQLIPPFILLLLIFIPFDLITSIVWIIAEILILISAISLVTKLVKLIYYKCKKQPDKFLSVRDKLVRPALTIAIFIFAIFIIRLSQGTADKYAVQISKSIQNECNTNTLCPETVKDWDMYGRESLIFYGKYGTKYHIYYRPSEDKKEFTITVRHNIDEGFEIMGGNNKPLKTHLWNANGLSVDGTLE